MQNIWHFITQWFWIPLLGIYLGVFITIISENRNPGKSLAYILMLVFLPGIGLIIYYFVGRKPLFKGSKFKKIQKSNESKLNEYFASIKVPMHTTLGKLEQKMGTISQTFNYLYLQKQSPITEGNAVTLLNNGEEKFSHLFNSIQNARAYIHLEYYMWTADDIGNKMADLLINKHREGVEVRVIFDDVGSNKIKKIPKRLKEAGIPFAKTLPVMFGSLANSNYRNHRKVVVIDGEMGYLGGINLDDRYLNNGKHRLFWRDTTICIEGPAIQLLQFQFLLSWFFSNGENNFKSREFYLEHKAPLKAEAVVAIVASGPDSTAPYILETFLLAISQAKRKVQICTPYFIPTDQLTSALVIAAAKGVEVEIILPGTSDSFIVQHASFSFIKPLLERRVKVYLYQKGFIHSKTMVVDDQLAFIGTVNMDTRSFYLNFEITSAIYDTQLCEQMSTSFEADKSESKLLTLEAWVARPVMQRAFDSVCRLVSPLL